MMEEDIQHLPMTSLWAQTHTHSRVQHTHTQNIERSCHGNSAYGVQNTNWDFSEALFGFGEYDPESSQAS